MPLAQTTLLYATYDLHWDNFFTFRPYIVLNKGRVATIFILVALMSFMSIGGFHSHIKEIKIYKHEKLLGTLEHVSELERLC